MRELIRRLDRRLLRTARGYVNTVAIDSDSSLHAVGEREQDTYPLSSCSVHCHRILALPAMTGPHGHPPHIAALQARGLAFGIARE